MTTVEQETTSLQGDFVPLEVLAVERLTHDSVVVTFRAEAGMSFTAGQHLVLRRLVEGEELRRTYSICASALSGDLRIGVKRLDGGAFSEWVNSGLAPGDVVEARAPAGRFTPRLGGDGARRHVAIAAGSGITPIISIVTTLLEAEPASTVALWYGNKTSGDIMFLEELCDLKDRFPARFELMLFTSREEQEVELLSGRLDADRVKRLLGELEDPSGVDEWWLCGPFAMVTEIRATLVDAGAEQRHVHLELFHVDGELPRAARAARSAAHQEWDGRVSQVTVQLGGRATVLQVPFDGDPILDSLTAARSDAPYSCKSGACGTCRARLLEGQVEMDVVYALEPDEIEQGYVLMCQSHPSTEQVRLEVE
ncbi:MAG TPA: 2Fe-2S iron-sulfur cluster-binding protein [Acidimicrobiales bacterium]|nr:2Fe-2S iron-sulfur cluster-binding protein [Acidimicrobiales bacterium]